jgi:hypothetical protein
MIFAFGQRQNNLRNEDRARNRRSRRACSMIACLIRRGRSRLISPDVEVGGGGWGVGGRMPYLIAEAVSQQERVAIRTTNSMGERMSGTICADFDTQLERKLRGTPKE